MPFLRNLIRCHRGVALLAIALALSIKALVPAGYMIQSTPASPLGIAICSAADPGMAAVQLAVPVRAGEHDGQHEQAKQQPDNQCGYSALTKAAISGADAVLLALVFAFILVLGLAPSRQPPIHRLPRFLPPLRGPPATV
jgi:hypothetical protein